MQLKVKFLKWSAGLPAAMLNEETAKEMGLHAQDRITLKTISARPRESVTIIDVVKGLVNKNEIAVSSELKNRLKLKAKEKVEVSMMIPSKSLEYIKKKIDDKPLSGEEIDSIIGDIVNNSLSDSEIALFISAMDQNGMNMKETVGLIEAIQKTGSQMKFRNKFVADKHSIGGVPGNRTTPLVVSICAAAGLIFPKNSSRAITSPAGTADVIETIARVEYTVPEIKKIVEKVGACMVWGGAVGMVPADSKIIRIEKALNIDPPAQLLASIMSKKLAAGSKYILIDIPYGPGAKVSKKGALALKKKFEYLGKHFKKKIKCVLTDGREPIGNGVGPALELKDIVMILDPTKQGPRDLEEKALFLSGEIFEMTGKAKKNKGVKMAREILYSGRAFEKFNEIIKAQEGSLAKLKKIGKTHDILSRKTGRVSGIENKKINSLARMAGCPIDKFSGVYLHVRKGDKIKKGQKIITIHAESSLRLNEAVRHYGRLNPIKIK
ncbi:MAG: thymidine phosphorylase family protein [Nanoarchaeota archaeon]|nr:thymidine phosphorylase family protein [Nanoarchaeota archaeon]